MSWRIVQYSAGVDAEAQRIILARWATWCAFIERWLSAFSDWDARLLLPERRADLRAYLDALSRSVLRVDYGVDDPRAYEARVKALRRAYAQGHWDSTTMLATVLNDKLGTSRIITQALAQEVFDFLMPKLDL